MLLLVSVMLVLGTLRCREGIEVRVSIHAQVHFPSMTHSIWNSKRAPGKSGHLSISFLQAEHRQSTISHEKKHLFQETNFVVGISF